MKRKTLTLGKAPPVRAPVEQDKPTRLTTSDCIRLFAKRFPAAFARKPAQPLKVGIHKDAFDRIDDVSRKAIRRALSVWTRQPGYLRAVAARNAIRVDLDGNPAGPVADAERIFALARLNGEGSGNA